MVLIRCLHDLLPSAAQVMGIEMPKSRKVSCSNWAARSLNMQQIKYACLDVFVAGQVRSGQGGCRGQQATADDRVWMYGNVGIVWTTWQISCPAWPLARNIFRLRWQAPTHTACSSCPTPIPSPPFRRCAPPSSQIFRGLRLWHSSPSPCPACLHPVGTPMEMSLACAHAGCNASFKNLPAYQMHCRYA